MSSSTCTSRPSPAEEGIGMRDKIIPAPASNEQQTRPDECRRNEGPNADTTIRRQAFVFHPTATDEGKAGRAGLG